MKIKKIMALALAGCMALCVALTPASAIDVDAETPLRVGLSYGSSAATSFKFSGEGGFQVGYLTNDGKTFNSVYSTNDTSITVTLSGGNYTVKGNSANYTYNRSENLVLKNTAGEILYNTRTYAGYIECYRNSSNMSVINVIDLESYVKGVITYEMSSSWPKEALKAQAVCARNYALRNLDKHESNGFDICNGTHCQSYGGTTRSTASSDAAVDECAGMVLTYENKLAELYYHASSGGYTENSENVWVAKIPYLTGVSTPYEDLDHATYGKWTYNVTAEEVGETFRAKGYDIGTVTKFYVSKRTDVGNAYSITVEDTDGKSVTVSKQNMLIKFPSWFRSMCFDITQNGSGGDGYYINGEKETAPITDKYILSADGVEKISSSSLSVLTANGVESFNPSSGGGETGGTGETTFTITGRGWGHNVGMSQESAKGMALNGWTYDEILAHFFQGTTLESCK